MNALVDPRELIGSAEAIEITGLPRSSFHVKRLHGTLPDPIATLACGPIWTRSQIEEWTAELSAQRP